MTSGARVLARVAATAAGAIAGAIPGVIADRTFLEPKLQNDLSDISTGIVSALAAIAIGVVGAILGADTAYRYARRRWPTSGDEQPP